MSAFVTTAYVEDGKLHVRNRKAFDQAVGSWPEGEYIVTVEKAHATRSIEQNKFYWKAFVQPLAEYTGHSANEIHAYLKKRFLPAPKVEIRDADGFVIDEQDMEPSTTTLNKVEFSEYLQQIEEFAASLNVRVGSHRDAA
jgi:hypothetical protein